MIQPRLFKQAESDLRNVWAGLPLMVRLILADLGLSVLLSWVGGLLAYVAAVPYFQQAYPHVWKFIWHGSGGTQDNFWIAYMGARDLVFVAGGISGVLIAQTAVIVHYLRKDGR